MKIGWGSSVKSNQITSSRDSLNRKQKVASGQQGLFGAYIEYARSFGMTGQCIFVMFWVTVDCDRQYEDGDFGFGFDWCAVVYVEVFIYVEVVDN